MNQKDISETNEHIRQYAYFYAKRKKLELYKVILLNLLMKEISSKEELKISEQKAKALKTPEYKNILVAIKNLHKKETECQWHLNKFIAASEAYITSSAFDRQNNWNIHNI